MTNFENYKEQCIKFISYYHMGHFEGAAKILRRIITITLDDNRIVRLYNGRLVPKSPVVNFYGGEQVQTSRIVWLYHKGWLPASENFGAIFQKKINYNDWSIKNLEFKGFKEFAGYTTLPANEWEQEALRQSFYQKY